MKPSQKTLIAGGVIEGFLLLAYLLATQHISQSLLLGLWRRLDRINRILWIGRLDHVVY